MHILRTHMYTHTHMYVHTHILQRCHSWKKKTYNIYRSISFLLVFLTFISFFLEDFNLSWTFVSLFILFFLFFSLFFFFLFRGKGSRDFYAQSAFSHSLTQSLSDKRFSLAVVWRLFTFSNLFYHFSFFLLFFIFSFFFFFFY